MHVYVNSMLHACVCELYTASYSSLVSCLPYVPLKGTVGASGDLAPLSHLALGMMGEGLMWSPDSGWSQARDVLHSHALKEVKLSPKEVRREGVGDGV